MADLTTSVEIEAPPEVVFEHLVDPGRMVRWMGQHAELAPVPGGSFAVDINGALFRGEFLEVERPRRVVVTWGLAGAADLPPGASQVEFKLTPTPTGTRLDLLHTGIPGSRAETHGAGWGNYLTRLRQVAVGADPGPDTWRAVTA
jgi:uncharacterized protein YndB with AHSA1/START domain